MQLAVGQRSNKDVARHDFSNYRLNGEQAFRVREQLVEVALGEGKNLWGLLEGH